MKVYALTVRNRALALLLGLAIVAAGGALLLVGVALLAGLAVVGGLIGTGVILYRLVRGRDPHGRLEARRPSGLDPSLEVFPDRPALRPEPPPREPNDD